MIDQPPSFDGTNSSKQNFVSLKEYFERRLFDMERATQAAQHNSEMALREAKEATSQRLLLLNESRDTLRDQTRLYVTKAEFEALRDSIQAEIKSIQKILYTFSGVLLALQVIIQFFASR